MANGKCADCGTTIDKPKTWCNDCYEKKKEKWNKEIYDWKLKNYIE